MLEVEVDFVFDTIFGEDTNNNNIKKQKNAIRLLPFRNRDKH